MRNQSVGSNNPCQSVMQTMRGHVGTIEVESREGEGTEFIIKIPLV